MHVTAFLRSIAKVLGEWEGGDEGGVVLDLYRGEGRCVVWLGIRIIAVGAPVCGLVLVLVLVHACIRMRAC